jgi:hypothetical protein
VNFIENYLLDFGGKTEVPVVVLFCFGFEAMNPIGVNIARLEAVHIDDPLAALAFEVTLTPSSTTRPFSVGSVANTKKFIAYLRKLFTKMLGSPSPH